MSKAELRLVDPDTGELIQPGCRECAEHVSKIAGLEGDLDVTQAELTKALRQIKAFKRDRDLERESDPQREEIMAIFDYWRERCQHPNARFDGKRFDLIKKARRSFSVEEIYMAIDGAAVGAYRDPQGKLHDRLGLILESAERVEDFCNRFARWKARQC